MAQDDIYAFVAMPERSTAELRAADVVARVCSVCSFVIEPGEMYWRAWVERDQRALAWCVECGPDDAVADVEVLSA